MLREILAADVFKLLLVFARLGAAIMLFPGFGSNVVLVRARLALAVAVAFVLMPALAGRLPKMPADPTGMTLLLAGEVTIGLFFGLLMHTLSSALDLAGNAIGYSMGLTNVFTYDPITEQPSQLIPGFLNLMAITMIFVTDTHHLMLRAVVDSYALFVPGQALPVDDMSATLVRTLSASFVVGLKLAAPSIIFAMTFNTGLALLNRLVPQVQVFFVGMPIHILAGLGVLTLALPPILFWFLRHYTDGFSSFLSTG